jgi:hypothetical protein
MVVFTGVFACPEEASVRVGSAAIDSVVVGLLSERSITVSGILAMPVSPVLTGVDGACDTVGTATVTGTWVSVVHTGVVEGVAAVGVDTMGVTATGDIAKGVADATGVVVTGTVEDGVIVIGMAEVATTGFVVPVTGCVTHVGEVEGTDVAGVCG